jgi:pilus assembly protein CpaF
MVLMGGVDLPMRAVREQIASAVDLVVHQARAKDGSRRITHVTEVVGIHDGVVALQDLYRLDHRPGAVLRPTGTPPRFLQPDEDDPADGVRR